MSIAATSDPVPTGARRTVATEANYLEAERAVDWLSNHGFPVERVSIVGTGLRSIEQVFRRLTTGRAALMGSAQGASLGLLFGALFGLFFTNVGAFFSVVLYGLVAGIVWGGLFGAVMQFARRGRREFASATVTQADTYEVQVDDAVAGEAKRMLDGISPPLA